MSRAVKLVVLSSDSSCTVLCTLWQPGRKKATRRRRKLGGIPGDRDSSTVGKGKVNAEIEDVFQFQAGNRRLINLAVD